MAKEMINFDTLAPLFEDKICAECGCIIEADDYITLPNGDYVCADCAEEYERCRDCGEYHRRDEMEIAYGEYVCQSCAEEYYTRCDQCGELICNEDVHETEMGDWWCEHCLDWYDYYYCSECGLYYHYDHYNNRADMCNDCARENGYDLIRSYHAHKCESPYFFITALKATYTPVEAHWFFGVEWELESDEPEADAKELHDILGERAYYEEDCSVDGFECIFQPHTYEALVNSEAIKRAFEYAQAHMSAYNTGMHVHVSRTAFGATEDEQNDNIAKLVLLHEEGFAFDQLVKLSRRDPSQIEDWCNPLRHKRYHGYSKDEMKTVAKNYAGGAGDHGTAINCANRATVEFRLGSGTVNYDEFLAWIEIIKLLVETSKKISIDDAQNFWVWFADANDDIKRYMAEHGVEWEEPVEVTLEDCKEIMVKLMDSINSACIAGNVPTLEYNQMLTVIAHANRQTRTALGFE